MGFYVPFDQYQRIAIHSDYASQIDDSRGKRLSVQEPSFVTHESAYFVTSGLFGPIEDSWRIGYELVPETLWDGPLFNVPAHRDISRYGHYCDDTVTTPEGHFRHRSCDTGMRVTVAGKPFVFGDQLTFKPLLPDGADRLTIDMAQDYEAHEGRYGWRASMSPEGPIWHEHRGFVVAEYTTQFDDTHYRGFAQPGKEIIDFWLHGLEGIDHLLSIEQELGIRRDLTPTLQLAMF